MAKYVRSKRRTIGGNHHHKGKAKKGKGKSKGKKKGKNKGCSTVKKCRAEIKKLESRIIKIPHERLFLRNFVNLLLAINPRLAALVYVWQ